MAIQDGWTKPVVEPETYPGVLRGYRHFNNEDSLKAVYSKFDYDSIREGEWWVAHCGTEGTSRSEHAVPEAKCRCGFYVNYYPQNSFYSKDADAKYPRAVVEASGRLILGEKGFRAQKLRLIALAPIRFGLGTYVAETFPWVKLYTDTEKMYEDYPQVDLTSLLGKEVVSKNLSAPTWGQVDANSSINAATNYALSLYGGYNRVPAPVNSSSIVVPIQHLVALTVGQGIIYQGNLYDGVKLTMCPQYDHVRIERYAPNYSMFDYSQLGNPSYIGPYSGPPSFVQDLKLSDLNNCMIEVSSDYKTMYQLTFDYQGIQYEWNFVGGTHKWRKIY